MNDNEQTAAGEMTYEQAMARLEQISRQIESNELAIDKLAATVREARKLAEFCRGKLMRAEEDIKKALAGE